MQNEVFHLIKYLNSEKLKKNYLGLSAWLYRHSVFLSLMINIFHRLIETYNANFNTFLTTTIQVVVFSNRRFVTVVLCVGTLFAWIYSYGISILFQEWSYQFSFECEWDILRVNREMTSTCMFWWKVLFECEQSINLTPTTGLLYIHKKV